MKSVSDNYAGSFNSPFYKIVAVSAAVHILIVFLVLYGRFLPSKAIEYNPVYNVKLVPDMTDQETGSAGAVSEKPEKTVSPVPIVTPPVQSKVKQMILPIKKKAPDKKELLSAIKHINSELKKQELLNAIQETAMGRNNQGINRQGTKGIKAGEGSGTGSPPSGPAAEQYYSLVWQKIQGAWLIPPSMADASYGYETIVDITINKDGTVTDVGIEKSSGSVYFDQTAIRAIKKASPLPKFPPSWLQKSMEIGIKFSCKEGCK